MPFKFDIGDDVTNTAPLQSDQGPVPVGQQGIVVDRTSAAGQNLYTVRFINLTGPDKHAPAFENQLAAA